MKNFAKKLTAFVLCSSMLFTTACSLFNKKGPDGTNEGTGNSGGGGNSEMDKYVVKDFHVSEEPYRYYNIVTLYRNFNPDIDEVTPGGVIENFELGIGVGQQWCAYYLNNTIVYHSNGTFLVGMGMGIQITWSSMSRPSGMTYAAGAFKII